MIMLLAPARQAGRDATPIAIATTTLVRIATLWFAVVIGVLALGVYRAMERARAALGEPRSRFGLSHTAPALAAAFGPQRNQLAGPLAGWDGAAGSGSITGACCSRAIFQLHLARAPREPNDHRADHDHRQRGEQCRREQERDAIGFVLGGKAHRTRQRHARQQTSSKPTPERQRGFHMSSHRYTLQYRIGHSATTKYQKI